MNRIRFTLPDVGLREISGLAYVDEGFLVLKVQNALMGEFDVEQETLKIEPGALEEVSVTRGLFRDRLIIRPRRPELLDAIPGEHVAALELRVSRKQRSELGALVDEFHALPRSVAALHSAMPTQGA